MMPYVEVPGFGTVHINTRGATKKATRRELEEIGLAIAKTAEAVSKELKPMTQAAVATINESAVQVATLEKVITGGDLGSLTALQLVDYYVETCESLGLNWRTKPFDVIAFKDGRKRLYLNVEGAEQLAALHNVNVTMVRAEQVKNVYQITMLAELPNGRKVTKSGATTTGSLDGEALANALMKAESKAYRRAVRAICGLNGLLEQKEVHAYQRPADAAEVLQAVIVETIGGINAQIATEEPITEIQEVEAVPLTPLQLAKRRLWSMAQVREVDHEALQKLAGAHNFELDNGNLQEYEEVTQWLIDHEDAASIIAQAQD